MNRSGKYVIAPPVLWLLVFFVVPLLIVVAVSFASRTAYGQVVFQWTWENYVRLFDGLYLSLIHISEPTRPY